MTRAEHIAKYNAWAITSTFGTGLFPSVKLAQSIIESASSTGVPGESSLAKKYNNFFGIKAAGGWKGKVVNLATGEYLGGKNVTITDGFRVYGSPYDSFHDHTRFLLENSRYKYAIKAKTPEEQARLLKSAGYATAPDYADAIINIINAYGLKKYDQQKPTMQRLEIFLAIIGILILLYFALKTLNVRF